MRCSGNQAMNEHDRNVRSAAYWLRRAIRARASATRYPDDGDALENIAEMYEQLAERMVGLGSQRFFQARTLQGMNIGLTRLPKRPIDDLPRLTRLTRHEGEAAIRTALGLPRPLCQDREMRILPSA